jgi:hypothetical protein
MCLLVASNTIPVLSRTLFAMIVVSNSMKSALPGVVVGPTDTLTVTALAFLLQILTVAIANVEVGHEYTVVLVVAERSLAPNLPVGIIYFSVVFIYCKK